MKKNGKAVCLEDFGELPFHIIVSFGMLRNHFESDHVRSYPRELDGWVPARVIPTSTNPPMYMETNTATNLPANLATNPVTNLPTVMNLPMMGLVADPAMNLPVGLVTNPSKN
jgi:hypothetical protein